MSATLESNGEPQQHGRSVFISHASKNFNIADQLRSLLEAQRVSCWIAPRDIPAGGQYGTEIVKAIHDCSIVVLVLTEEANRSKAVANEIERAFGNEKVIVPVRLRDIKPSAELEFFVSNAQWVDAMDSPLKSRVNEIIAIVQAVEMRKPVAPPAPERKTFAGTLERALERALRHKMLSAVTGFAVLAGLGLATLGLQASMHADLGNATHAISNSAERIDSAASSIAGTGHAVAEMDQKLDKVKLETSSDPRKELANRGILWTWGSFNTAVTDGDTPTVALFLQGGMGLNEGTLRNAYERSNDATRELLLEKVASWPERGCFAVYLAHVDPQAATPSQKAIFQRSCGNPDGRKMVGEMLATLESSHQNAVQAYEQELKARPTFDQCVKENMSPAGLQKLVQLAPVGAMSGDPGWGGNGPDPQRDMYRAVLDAQQDTNHAHALETVRTGVQKYCTFEANAKPNIDTSDKSVQQYRTLMQWIS
ncbi:toll/interleukin-1 receptor domain-containing protein [Paraburkholderia pallida]|uniref:Toll/interleukin-1 receptor domain-containing protein n=1 Tax=Paraburkholderia pallida TaxID=2547399 RepID=A0A4P7CU17_9BURK|nr:toll/interleukin-1 receptor domain-containing protein [Paraburkholderia pallida]QBQ99515.1 toll/interleukin-1 receptor domain-containing protein [Paraburkholderia pallida]